MSELTDIEDALLAALKTIRDNWAGLLNPGSGGGSEGPKSSDVVTPTDRRVSLSHEVTLCLSDWARYVVTENNLTHRLPLDHDTLGLITLLERWARWFSGHEAAPEVLANIQPLAEQVRLTVNPPKSEWLHLGDCPLMVKGDDLYSTWDCCGQVRVRIGGDDEATCSDCEHTAPIGWWENLLGLGIAPCTTGALVLEIHARLGIRVSDQTIRNWAKAGLISQYVEPFGPAPRWPRWDVRAVLDVVARMGRDCASCDKPWHGHGTICTSCFISSRSAATRHAQPIDPFPIVKVRRLAPVVVPDVADDDKPDRCHWSDLIIEQCACANGGHARVS